MSGLESKAVFENRALAIGIESSTIQALQSSGLDTFGKYAFSCAYQPGSADEAPLKTLLTEVLGSEPSIAVFAPLRRLYYEAHTLALSEMRSRVERKEDDAPRKLPPPERTVRLERQKLRLGGLKLEGPLLPAHSLVDKVCQQLEDSQLKYVPISECISRDQEMLGVKKMQSIALDSNGSLKLHTADSSAKADLTSDLKVREAFMRRSLAYDQCGMVSFETLDQWVDKLFRSMDREPPKGYRKVTLEQVLNADRELWVLVSEYTGSSVAPRADGSKPVEEAINRFKDHPEVAFLLLPLPHGTSSGSTPHVTTLPPRSDHEQLRKWPKGGKGKGSGKGKTDGKFTSTSVPSLPPGCVRRWGNKPICINFNGRGCDFAKAGKRCRNGFHVCYKDGCHKPAAFGTCAH